MTNTALITAGRTVQTVIALVTLAGPYIADFNETHVYNPNWPPHARFHNGQTMSFGLALGLLTNFFIWKNKLFPSFLPSVNARDSAVIATITGSLYWICGLSGILYPGAKWLDPEFKKDPFSPDEVGPQAYFFSANAVLAWIGLWLTTQGMQDKHKVA